MQHPGGGPFPLRDELGELDQSGGQVGGPVAVGPGEETTRTTRLTLVPASLAKGLEYDYVVLDEPQAVVDGEPDERTGLRRLYVALTRAVSGLIVTHATGLPQQLA